MPLNRALALWLVGAVPSMVVACTPAPAPSTAPAPVAAHAPTAEELEAARRDSANERSARAARVVPVGRFAGLARPAGRTDSLAARPLHRPVRVCAGGDVMLGTNLDTVWAHAASARMRTLFRRADDPASLVAPLRPWFGGADVALVNVESAIGEGPAPAKCGPGATNCFAFRAPVASAAALRSLAPHGVVVGNVANNHARDAGTLGQDSTVASLLQAGVLVTGDDTLPTLVPTAAGDTLAFLGFYSSRDTPDLRDTAAVRRHVSRAADRFPVVIVTMHLGAEGRMAQHTQDSTERFLGVDRGNPVAFADAAVRGGAAMVLGHGPHVIRAVEWRERGALIAYSLGNLLTYGPFALKEPLNRGAVLCATVDETGRVSAAALTPTRQRTAGIVARDRARRAFTLADSLGRIDFPATGAHVTAQGALIPRAPR